MNRLRSLSAPFLAAAALSAAAADRNLVWANRGSDMNAAASWDDAATGAAATEAPTSADRLFFSGLPGVQPRLTASLEVRAVCFGPVGSSGRTTVSASDGHDGFSNCGWTISGATGAELVLPQSWNNAGGWNFAFSQATYGTNVVDVPVRFASTATGNNSLRPVMPSGGRLVFRKAATFAAPETSVLRIDGDSEGSVAFEDAGSALPETVRLGGAVTLAVVSPGALSGVRTLRLDNSDGSSRPQSLSNETGGALSLPNVTEITSGAENKNFRFRGDGPMSFPAAAFRPALDKNHYQFHVDVPVSVRTVGNAAAGAGSFIFRKLGRAPLYVAEDVFAGAPAGQTNRFDVVDGALVLESPAQLARERTLFGTAGSFFKDGARPALGLVADLAVPAGDAPGAFACYDDQTCAMGLAAFGGDRTATFYGGGAYAMGADVAAVDSRGFGSKPFRRQATTLLFGAPEADGTATMGNPLDLNLANTHWTGNARHLYALRGAAHVAGRIGGRVFNSGAAGTLCRILKYGDGALALDGDVECLPEGSNPNVVHEGGLLANAGFAGPVLVEGGAWFGGTGTLGAGAALTVEGGAELRPGEFGGTLRTEAPVTLKDGAALAIDIGPDSNGCLAAVGSGQALRATGPVTLRLRSFGGLSRGRTVKIVDVSGASTPDWSTLAYLPRYSFELPEDGSIRNPVLTKDATGVYLTFSVDSGRPMKVLFR